MKKMVVSFVAVMFFICAGDCYAECGGSCAQYCGSGYCTDYIFYRLGVKQQGNAKDWSGNISADQVRSGDVAIFDFGEWGHVAVIESVNGDEITISEWNWGVKSTNPIEQSCGVTVEFGQLHSPFRTISKSTATRFWRPDFSDDDKVLEVKVRQVGSFGWYPANKSCINAERWYRVENGRAIQEFGDNGICWSIDPIAHGVWYDVVFGSDDLPAQCTE